MKKNECAAHYNKQSSTINSLPYTHTYYNIPIFIIYLYGRVSVSGDLWDSNKFSLFFALTAY